MITLARMIQQTSLGILTGRVKRFSGNGRRLGYPTANIQTTTSLNDGVYFGYADLAGYSNHPALIFIGTPVTVGDTQRRLEAHLLNIDDKDYYDMDLKIVLYHFHRANKKLASIEELVEIMHEDERAAIKWFDKQGE